MARNSSMNRRDDEHRAGRGGVEGDGSNASKSK
jgi:hypothetical protein